MMKFGVKEAKSNFMLDAIEIAKQSNSDIPIGCVIVQDGKIIAAEHNKREELQDITAHAEMLAIKKTQEILQNSRLTNCDLYVTLEPCPMCSWTILQSGIKNIYFGSYNTQYGAMKSAIDLVKLGNSKIKIYGGIEEEKCDKILKDFFERIRKNEK